MLRLSDTLINKPVWSLRTGIQIATATKPIINPNNLKIEGMYCQDRFEKNKQTILLTQDIRELNPRGFVVNDHDSLSELNDLHRLKQLISIHFEIIGKQAVTVSKTRLGKVSDYAAEVNSLFILKLYVSQSLIKNFTGGSLSIDRNQIVEITPKKIIVQDLEQAVLAGSPVAV